MKLELKDIQNETLSILKEVDKICKELNIKYVLVWGTLIGAVRHNGFIPWDDDLDIMMSREDYNTLKNYFVENKDRLQPLEFFSKDTREEYPYMLGRICNTNFHMISENEKDYGMGTFIDVYPLDGAGNGKDKFLYFRACTACTLLGMKTRLHFQKTFSWKKNIIKRIMYMCSKILSEKKLVKKLVSYSEKYSYENSDYLCCMQWMDGGQIILFKRDVFENISYIDFEGNKFPIPHDYDNILRNVYGDYMKLPPEEQRIGHHYYDIYTK